MLDDQHHDPRPGPLGNEQKSDPEVMDGLRPRRRRRRIYDLLFAFAFVAVLGLFLFGNRLFSPPPPTQVAVARDVAGTWVSITAYAAKPDKAKAAIEAAFARMREVLELATGTDPTRELRRLNTQGRLLEPSADLWTLVTAALDEARVTGGAYDPTAAPLESLWDTQNAQGQAEAIDRALAHVGIDRIDLRTDPREIVLAPGTTIDLTGIATGYAVDQGLASLKADGIVHALIAAGSVTAGIGGRPEGAAWQIPLGTPDTPDGVITRFAITDEAVATVGDPGRVNDPSKPIPRIVDPRTGTLAADSSSATVIAPTAIRAQPLSRAAFVLGPKAGLALIEALPDVEALLFGSGDPPTPHRSSGLARYQKTNGGT